MKEFFVEYKEALALKELGFNKPCLARHIIMTEWEIPTGEIILQMVDCLNSDKYLIKAPLYQQAFSFFREKHKINAQIAFCEYGIKSENSWKFTIDNPTGRQRWQGFFKSYEKAQLHCVQYLISITKK